MRERREVGIGAVTGRIPKGPPVCFIATEARHGAQRYGVHACMLARGVSPPHWRVCRGRSAQLNKHAAVVNLQPP